MNDLIERAQALLNGPKRYPDADETIYAPQYVHHVNAMTAEGLHSKSAIAEQLAYRDVLIAELLANNEQLEAARAKLHGQAAGYAIRAEAAEARLRELCEMKPVMWANDECTVAGKGTHPWCPVPLIRRPEMPSAEPTNTRDAGPSAWGGRNAGLRRGE